MHWTVGTDNSTVTLHCRVYSSSTVIYSGFTLRKRRSLTSQWLVHCTVLEEKNYVQLDSFTTHKHTFK